MRPERTRRTGHRDQHAEEVSIECQRHLSKGVALNHASGISTIGLQHRRFAGDHHRLFERAHAERDVDADSRIDVDLDVFARELAEANELTVHAVYTRRQVIEAVVAALVGDRRAGDVRAGFRRGYRCARHGAAAFIFDIAEEGAVRDLCGDSAREENT